MKRKKKRRKNRIGKPKPLDNVNKHNQSKEARKSSFWGMTNIVWRLFVVVSTMGGVVCFYWVIKDRDMTPHERRFANGYVHGILLPFNLKDKDLIFIAGSSINAYKADSFVEWKGMDDLINAHGENPFTFKVKKIGNRLFTQILLVDRYGEKLGVIDGEKYEFTVGIDKVDFDGNGIFFEVVDRDRNVLFGMKYELPNKYYVHGYFVSENRIAVINQSGFSFFEGFGEKESAMIEETIRGTEYFNPSWKNGYRPH